MIPKARAKKEKKNKINWILSKLRLLCFKRHNQESEKNAFTSHILDKGLVSEIYKE